MMLVIIKYGLCDENHQLNSEDIYLINDYDWTDYEYSKILDHLEKLENEAKVDLGRILSYI